MATIYYDLPAGGVIVDFELPTPAAGYALGSATLILPHGDSSPGSTITIRAITAEYATGATNVPVSTASVTATSIAEGTINVDVSSLMTQPFYGFRIEGAFGLPSPWNPQLRTLYVAMPPVGVTVDVPSVGLSALANEPTVTIVNPVNIDLTLETLALTATANEPVVEVKVNVSSTLGTATASLESYEAIAEASTSPDAVVDVTTVAIVVPEPVATVSAGTVMELSDTDTVMLGAYDPSIDLTNNVIAELDTPNIGLTHIRVTDVNGEPVLPSESEDRYFNATMDTLIGVTKGYRGGLAGTGIPTVVDAPRQTWFRMNERSGTKAVDRLSYLDSNGNPQMREEIALHNITLGLNDGPEGRHHFGFNGDAYAVRSVAMGGGGGNDNGGMEFTFRTEKKNQFIMSNSAAYGNLSVGMPEEWELWMVDGRLEVRFWGWNAGYSTFTRKPVSITKGFTNLADGDWHHVVLQMGYAGWQDRRNPNMSQWGLEMYIDANLEVRRRHGVQAVNGFPTFIGGRPGSYYPSGSESAEELPRSLWFQGDMTELVYREGRALSEDEVARQRDTMMGILPYYAAAPRIELKAPEAITRGNKPRVLVLHYGASSRPPERAVEFTVEPVVKNVRDVSPETIRPMRDRVSVAFFGLGETIVGRGDAEAPDPRYLKTVHYVSSVPGLVGDFRRDPITDNNRLIDLDVDLNMDEFDIISVVGYPGQDDQMGSYDVMDARNIEPMVPARQQLERVNAQVKEQVISHGKSLLITDPFSAIAMGLVDQVDVVPEIMEKEPALLTDRRIGAINPGFDGHAYAIDPFNGGEGPLTRMDENGIPRVDWLAYANLNKTESSRIKAAARYVDHHGNNSQRVRAIIDGLTTQPGWVKTDQMEWWNVNPANEPPYVMSRAYEDKRAGLKIGDTFHLDATKAAEDMYRTDNDPFNGTVFKHNSQYRIAAPMSAVKVGTVVTSFARTFHAGLEEAAAAFQPRESGQTISDLVGNPWQDHAISIAVQPGDIWDGQPVTGKVFINFTESMQFLAASKNVEQIMAWAHHFPNSEFPVEYPESRSLEIGDEIRYSSSGDKFRITPEMVKWNFSTAYGSQAGSEIQLPSGSKPNWGWSAGGTRGTGLSGGGAVALDWSWKPAADILDIPVPTMTERGLSWLATDLDMDGEVRVNNTTVKVDVAAHEAVVETSSNAVVDLSTARVTVENYTDADTIPADVTALVGTAAVTLKSSGLVTEVVMETATVQLNPVELVNTFMDDFDWTDAILLTLPRQIITLTLEDN